MVASDKESLLNDIPAMCHLIECELLKIYKMSNLVLFLIKNKKWA